MRPAWTFQSHPLSREQPAEEAPRQPTDLEKENVILSSAVLGWSVSQLWITDQSLTSPPLPISPGKPGLPATQDLAGVKVPHADCCPCLQSPHHSPAIRKWTWGTHATKNKEGCRLLLNTINVRNTINMVGTPCTAIVGSLSVLSDVKPGPPLVPLCGAAFSVEWAKSCLLSAWDCITYDWPVVTLDAFQGTDILRGAKGSILLTICGPLP